MKKIHKAILAVAIFAAFAVHADPPTPGAAPSQGGASIGVEVGQDVSQVKIVNASGGPQVIAKTYVLKHADPYEIRSVLLSAVRGTSIRGARTGVECIKYMDGKGAVVVSAEAYRFGKQPGGGMSIDELVEKLDQPGASSAPEEGEFKLIFPQNIDASTAARMLRNSGLLHDNDPYELQAGGGKARVDPSLNAILVKTSPSNMKQVDAALKAYDQPVPEVFINLSVYELESESDESLGLDYQRWRNSQGSSLAGAGFGGSFPGIAEANTCYLNFSPKISSAYLEYLRSEGKAGLVQGIGRMVQSGKDCVVDIASTDPNVDDTGVLRTGLATGLHLKLRPLVSEKSATVDLQLRLSSLLGFDKERKPRIETKEFSSVLSVANDGSRYVIGGLESKTRLETFSGATDFLTKVLGRRSDGLRSTRMLLVLECVPTVMAPTKAGEGAAPSRQ